MAELVAGAFLSSSLQVAFERLASREVLDFFLGRKLNDGLLKKLHIILISVNQVIKGAEEAQYRNPNVKQWVDMLKDEVFKAEDLLDEIATEASRQKLEADSHNVTSKVRGFFTTPVNQNLSNKRIESSINQVLDNLEYLIKQNKILGLRKGPVSGIQLGMNGKVITTFPKTSLIDESNMHGRDADKDKIIELLLPHSKCHENQNMGDNKLSMNVIAIVGMGGVGKTTLAQLVYEDRKIKDEFQHRAWVTISENFDYVQATNEILVELGCQTQPSDSLYSLQHKLKEKLMGKKIFFVLDDVWNENRQIWDVFQAPFKGVAVESKILVTTRSEKVAVVMHCTDTYDLKPLADEDCWKLFANHAFTDQHHCKDPEFESIGRQIIKKCGGLPLAIKTLGGLLYTKRSHENWDKILKSNIWDLSEDDSNIIPSLRLSYHYLPSNLKRCFAYCSIFPKDYLIDMSVLIQLWMAEGLLHSSCKGETIEKVGNEIFNDLKSRSFFEPSKKGHNYFIMHDLLNDLVKSVMGEFCLQLDGDKVQEISPRVRYLSMASDFKTVDISKNVFMCHQLRSFLNLQKYAFEYEKIDMVYGFTRMRALSLNGCKNLIKLTNDIANLKQLRYLDLSDTDIEKCPDSMCSMINLQTLKLKGCTRLRKLPSKFHKLINLNHLDLENSGIEKMPKYMGKLEHLQTMPQFVVSENKGFELKELGALKSLKGTLIIMFYLNSIIIDPENARAANLKGKHLDKLKLEFHGSIKRCKVPGEMEEQILKALEPKSSVKELKVKGYGGARFPDWFDGIHLPNVTSLILRGCKRCVKLPPLGQLPSLERLQIWGLDGIKEIGEEFCGNGSSNVPFRSLSYLRFEDLREWKEWKICYVGDSFPCLEELNLRNCPNLKMCLPQQLPSLKKLRIVCCNNLKTSLPKASAMEELYL